MRCFIAIEFSDAIKALLAGVQESLREERVGGNYTHQPNFHLTLKFLGEIDADVALRLEPILSEVASKFGFFKLKIGKLGKFSRGNKAIVWCGIENNRALESLQNEIARSIDAEFHAFRDGGGFSPHITLVREAALRDDLKRSARDAGNKSDGFEGLLENTGMPGGVIEVKGISLMESLRVNGTLKYVQKRFYPFPEHQ